MIDLNVLFYYVQVIDRQGFAAAARALNMPKSTISKRIAQLEQHLGVRLIERTTRKLSVTELGWEFYHHAAAALMEVDAAENLVKFRMAEPRGLVRISASLTTAQMGLSRILTALAKLYPQMQISLTTTNRFVDLVDEGIDIAVRSHRQPLAYSGNIQRRIGYAPNYLVAAPGYLSQSGRAVTVETLQDHQAILPDHQSRARSWSLHQTGRPVIEVTPQPVFFTADPTTLMLAVRSGLGIANLPHGLCWSAIAAGELVRLLPEWEVGGAELSILTTHRAGRLPAIQVTVDYLASELAKCTVFR